MYDLFKFVILLKYLKPQYNIVTASPKCIIFPCNKIHLEGVILEYCRVQDLD